MDRHRKIANEVRVAKGLHPLGRGPRHSTDRERVEYQKRQRMKDSQNPASNEFQYAMVAGTIAEVDRSTDETNNLEPGAGSDQLVDHFATAAKEEVTIPLHAQSLFMADGNSSSQYYPLPLGDEYGSASNSESFDTDEGGFQHEDKVDVGGSNMESGVASFDNMEDNVVGLEGESFEENKHVQSVASSESTSDNEASPEGSSGSDCANDDSERNSINQESMIDSQDSESEAIDLAESASLTTQQNSAAFQSGAFLRFREWALTNKEWVNTFLQFAFSGTLMNRVMQLINAPFKPITLRRNMLRYSGLQTVRYICCSGHMLVCREAAVEPGVILSCDVCVKLNTMPNWDIFEYIPILPRLRSWVSSEETCADLFEYLRKQLEEREANPNSYGPLVYYEDIYDGQLFRRLVDKNEGKFENFHHSLFIAPSADGFQVFANKTYDCWPIVAINHNLAPNRRYLIDNLIPLGFIKGPSEPVKLDTFFVPLREEIESINADGGESIQFYDSSHSNVRAHILHFTGDSPAAAKAAGTTGSNGKRPCRFCMVCGYFCTRSRHYYYPSRVVLVEGGRRRNVRLYDIDSPPLRRLRETRATIERVGGAGLSSRQRENMQRDTGIKGATELHNLPDIVPFASFPLDTMHLVMNICKDVMELLRGENSKLLELEDQNDGFVLSEESLDEVDAEIGKLAKGTSERAFGPPLRPTAKFKQWKAAECQTFLRYYVTCLLHGHLPVLYINGLHFLSLVTEYISWPVLSQEDVDELDHAAKRFVKHFELHYYKYDINRVGLCKSTIHALVHLGDVIRCCGPLVNTNQFWVERYIGVMKQRLNARRLPAEAMTESTKFRESCKMFYKTPFRKSTEDLELNDDDSSQDVITPLAPRDLESLQSGFHRRFNTRRLLVNYLCGFEGLTPEAAEAAVRDDEIVCFGRIRVPAVEGYQVIGASDARRHRQTMARSDYYIAADFALNDENTFRECYYGKVLKVLQYKFRIPSGEEMRTMVMVSWADRLQADSTSQIFRPSLLERTFTKPTVESPSIISHPIGVLEHRSPGIRGKRTYFIDPNRVIHRLLEEGRAGPDGVDRSLGGMR